MRRLSTRIGVYAILLIAAFYGTLSVMNQQGKTTQDAAEIIQKQTTSTQGKEKTANSGCYLSKNDNGKAVRSVSLKPVSLTRTMAITEPGFFTHSATIQHYISTI
jgi:hypothetical protein